MQDFVHQQYLRLLGYFDAKGQSMYFDPIPRGFRYTTIMELGPQSHNRAGLLEPNYIVVVYTGPLG